MNDLRIRRAEASELDEIMAIYSHAQDFMIANGNTEQWKKSYPSRELIEEDISLKRLFVCLSGEKIECVFMYERGDDPTYAKIYDGEWQNNLSYGVMHRIASRGEVRGISGYCLSFCFEDCKNLRADTHRDNKVMQRVFEKNGFTRCGIIKLADGSERIAYQKIS